MPKGLPRSLSRGRALKKPIINQTIRVNTLVTATAAATGVGFGNVALAAFPEGNVLFLGAVANLRFSALGAALLRRAAGAPAPSAPTRPTPGYAG